MIYSEQEVTKKFRDHRGKCFDDRLVEENVADIWLGMISRSTNKYRKKHPYWHFYNENNIPISAEFF